VFVLFVAFWLILASSLPSETPLSPSEMSIGEGFASLRGKLLDLKQRISSSNAATADLKATLDGLLLQVEQAQRSLAESQSLVLSQKATLTTLSRSLTDLREQYDKLLRSFRRARIRSFINGTILGVLVGVGLGLLA